LIGGNAKGRHLRRSWGAPYPKCAVDDRVSSTVANSKFAQETHSICVRRNSLAFGCQQIYEPLKD